MRFYPIQVSFILNIYEYSTISYMYVSTHKRKITMFVQESPYQCGTPHWYGDFSNIVRVSFSPVSSTKVFYLIYF